MSALAMWANGASDHFYDLDRSKSPHALVELAEYMLDLGHGRGLMGKWHETSEDTYNKIHKLWKAATLVVDEKLGVQPDWGRW